ncbi:MAG: diadenylate cyclase CdaA [Planctomycetota bacterium]|jgi:diadenylate cyclase
MIEFFEEVWRSLTADWRPAVEIAVLAVLLYLVFRFLRGTRGAAVLRGVFFVGLAALVVLFIVAQAAGLARVVWVLERISALAAVGVLVIFQPEIRKGLVRLGQSPFVNLFVRRRAAVADEVVEAVASLSKSKTGALIAMEREESLADYAEGGVRLDAVVSSELLASLFAAGSAMHDGAVVIRGGRLAAGGCLLPLSDNPELAKSLGTRHRAATGITEESDAVTVVVSEETGVVSVGVRGELMRGLSVEDLRGILGKLCAEVEAAEEVRSD